MIGRTISHYRIVAQLGAGGMGVVYRAEDVRLGREVAIKFVSDDYAHDEQAVQRLRSEARAASALNHGNICTIYDVGEDDGHPFIVMELMKGETLRDRLARGPLKVHQLVDIGIDIADALQSTHSDGIIHRDIKPGNIFLTERGHVKILDFGLAKLAPTLAAGANTRDETLERTVAGVTLGTISYMSPEQATGEVLDGRTDIFSLGVVLYEAATGRHPFPGKTSAVTLAAILNKAPVAPVALNPEIPLRLQEVINNCLEKDRELRYQSAADLRADLKRVRRDIESGHTTAIEPISNYGGSRGSDSVGTARASTRSARLDSSQRAAEPSTKRSRPWLIGIAVATIALGAAGAFAVWRSGQSQSPEAVAKTAADPNVQNRLALAQATFDAKNYRAAAAYAAEVLSLDPNHVDARKIRDDSRAMLARFDAAIAQARQRMSAGDLQGAARALDEARSLDPTAPSLIEISSVLTGELQKRAAISRDEQRQESRQAKTVPPPPPPAPVRPAPSAPAVVDPVPPPVATAVPQPAPEVQPPPPPSPPQTAPAPQPATPEPASKPSTPPPAAVEKRESEAARSRTVTAEQDEAAIRRLTATYARAIETKDLGLFRSIKPNLSREEERRLQDGFRAVTSQRVEVTVTSIDHRGDEATVMLRRRDTIQAGGRQQTAESQQVMRLARAGGGWVIVEIR